MPPPSALRRMAPWLRYWLLSDKYGSIKAIYNIYIIIQGRKQNEGQKDLHILTSDLATRSLHLTLSCHDYHLCQIIFKSHHAIQNYGPDTKGFNRAYAERLIANCGLDLWSSNIVFALVALDTILVWLSFVPNNFQIPPCKTKLWARHKKVSSGPIYKS